MIGLKSIYFVNKYNGRQRDDDDDNDALFNWF